jgi:predicted flap endonuclease-1-like 5' DNA nuclease
MNALALIALVVVAASVGYGLRAWRERDARRRSADASFETAGASTPTSPGEARVAAAPAAAAPSRASAATAYACSLEEDRIVLFRALADARGETARYRQVVVDIERNAPPPLFDAPGTPDDLKLVVGIGPAIERILHQMGIGSYRQIARLTERDIDDIEARLAEFPGRIRRDGWVTQARALHAAKYGTNP